MLYIKENFEISSEFDIKYSQWKKFLVIYAIYLKTLFFSFKDDDDVMMQKLFQWFDYLSWLASNTVWKKTRYESDLNRVLMGAIVIG